MNLLLFEPAELADVRSGDVAVVTLAAADRRARHLCQVMRVSPGRSLRVGVLAGALGSAQVLEVATDGAVRLSVILDRPASPRPAVDLVLAMPRPKALARVIETVATMGVGRIDLVNAWRVDRSYLDSPRASAEALMSAARTGCEQGGTTWVPAIEVHRLLVPFLRSSADRWPPGATRLLAHPRGDAAIEEVVAPAGGRPVVVAIGPEGGWIDREVASFEALGFRPVQASAAVLRVETAVAAVLAQLELLRRV